MAHKVISFRIVWRCSLYMMYGELLYIMVLRESIGQVFKGRLPEILCCSLVYSDTVRLFVSSMDVALLEKS